MTPALIKKYLKMKRLLLAPLLFLLIGCSQDLTPGIEPEKYLELCNNSDLPGNASDSKYCYMVKDEDRDKITSKLFIEAAKELSRERLDICIRPEKYGYADSLRQERQCRDFLNEPHSCLLYTSPSPRD